MAFDFEGDDKSVILIVDDVEMNVELLAQMIDAMGYIPRTALSVSEAVSIMQEELPQLILSDILMPEVNGYQFCAMLKENPVTRQIPVIFVSAVEEMSDKKRAFDIGAVDFINKPYDFIEVSMRVNTHLNMYKMQKQLEYNNRRLNKAVSEQSQKIDDEKKKILKALAIFAEKNKDIGYGNHLANVSNNARLLAQGLNFTEKYENKISSSFIEAIELAATLHDIGKITVPKEIMIKPGPITAEQKAIIRTHTDSGAQMLMQIYPDYMSNEFVRMAMNVIQYHHERWNGEGYPAGLAGEKIPLAARIVMIVDVYDKMVCGRKYKPAISKEAAAQYIRDNAGRRFDPYIVEVFNKIVKQMKCT